MIGLHLPTGTKVQCLIDRWDCDEGKRPDINWPQKGAVYTLERYSLGHGGWDYIVLIEETTREGIGGKGRNAFDRSAFRIVRETKTRSRKLPESVFRLLDSSATISGAEIEKSLRPKKRRKTKTKETTNN